MTEIRVLVSGYGRMGREVLAGACRAPDLIPVGVLTRSAKQGEVTLPDGRGTVPCGADPEAMLAATRPDVVVDFTAQDWTARLAPAAVAAGVRPVIGTSGLPDAFVQDLARQCRERGVGTVIGPNFASGAVLMIHFARIAARFFDVAEIIELHHDQKADAPSGASLATARAMVEGRGRPFDHPETEKQTLPGTRGGTLDGVTLHSVRLPGLVAHQEVLFGGLGQTLTIRHDSTSRESFIPGVVLAVREVMRRQELVIGLDRVLGLVQ